MGGDHPRPVDRRHQCGSTRLRLGFCCRALQLSLVRLRRVEDWNTQSPCARGWSYLFLSSQSQSPWPSSHRTPVEAVCGRWRHMDNCHGAQRKLVFHRHRAAIRIFGSRDLATCGWSCRVGIALMRLGYSAYAGVICSFVGIIAGFIAASLWVFQSTAREGAARARCRPVRDLLSLHRHGIASNLGISAYAAAPLAIVALVAPAAQPAFALANKVVVLINSGLLPITNVIQGWVPRAIGDSARAKRSRVALRAVLVGSIVVGMSTALTMPALTKWLGNGQLALPRVLMALMPICIAATFFKAALERGVLATFERLAIVTRSVIVSAVVGLPLVAIAPALQELRAQ